MTKTFWQKAKEEIENKKIPISEFMDAVGATKYYIFNMDRSAFPDNSKLAFRISHYLGLDIDDMMNRKHLITSERMTNDTYGWDAIKSEMQARNMTNLRMSQLSGISQKTVRCLTRGRPSSSFEKLVAAADALGISLNSIYEKVGDE